MPVKSIKFNLTLKGHGVVQTDGQEQGSAMVYKRGDVSMAAAFDKHGQLLKNIVWAKGNFERYLDEEGKTRLRKILKISGDGLRHAIHREAMPANTPSILLSPESCIFATASLDMLIRGWLSLSKSMEGRKRSAYTITAAEAPDAQLNLELFANSAPKTKKSESSDEAKDEPRDTSLFARETTGDTCYNATGFIDVEELRFISVSDIYGRRAISDDMAELYRAQLSENLGSEVDVPRYWKRKNGSSNIPERGILLDNAQVSRLILHLLKGMANIHIVKSASGFAQTSELTIFPLKDANYAPCDGVKVFDGNVFNSSVIPTSFVSPWEEITEEEGRARVETIDSAIAANKKERKETKAGRGSKNKGKQGAPETTAEDTSDEE